MKRNQAFAWRAKDARWQPGFIVNGSGPFWLFRRWGWAHLSLGDEPRTFLTKWGALRVASRELGRRMKENA